MQFFILASLLLPGLLQAAVFGDSDNTNGIEDQRLTREESKTWPNEFRSVGRLYCSGLLKGSAILFKNASDNGLSVPMLITTRHVIEGSEVTNCAFTAESDSWRRSPVVSVVNQGTPDSVDTLTGQSVISKYSTDWAILELKPWMGWEKYALKSRSIEFDESFLMNGSPINRTAHLVGFDVMRNRMVVHSNCHFGTSEQSELLAGHTNLYWDDCDSTQGSSGGGLFISTEKGYQLAGLRVGSLFDEVVVGSEPSMGAKFNIDANINVSRAILGEMFEPVCIFAHHQCELVGNNDARIEN